MSNPLLSFERTFEMLRHVPPRQLLRGLELIERRRLAAWPPEPALPHFPPRRLLEAIANGWCFQQPWGELDVALPIDWCLTADDQRKLIGRAALRARLKSSV